MLDVAVRIGLSLLVAVGLLGLFGKLARGRRGGEALALIARRQLTRSSAVAVVQFADRVLMLGVTDQRISLLAETAAERLAAGPYPAGVGSGAAPPGRRSRDPLAVAPEFGPSVGDPPPEEPAGDLFDSELFGGPPSGDQPVDDESRSAAEARETRETRDDALVARVVADLADPDQDTFAVVSPAPPVLAPPVPVPRSQPEPVWSTRPWTPNRWSARRVAVVSWVTRRWSAFRWSMLRWPVLRRSVLDQPAARQPDQPAARRPDQRAARRPDQPAAGPSESELRGRETSRPLARRRPAPGQLSRQDPAKCWRDAVEALRERTVRRG